MFPADRGRGRKYSRTRNSPALQKLRLQENGCEFLNFFFCFFFLRNIIAPYFLSNGHSSLNWHIYKIDVKNKFINFDKNCLVRRSLT